MMESVVRSLAGGMLIGLAVSLLLFFNGRIAGISGILNGVLTPFKNDTAWRVAFLVGLLCGGLALVTFDPGIFVNSAPRPVSVVLIAGFLVGFGTVMGSGCTSGHGICGVSRLSPRSLIATAVFMVSGMMSVAVYRFIISGGRP